MKIKMLRNSLGSNDGFTVHHYDKGEEYDVSDDLGNSFIKEGVAEQAEAAPEQKAEKPAKNKAEAAPENK